MGPGVASETQTVRIGEAAAKAGVSERTLRYYEQLGLLAPAAHRPGGNRRYGEEEIVRVRRIRELQELLGFNLDEIRVVLATEDGLEQLRARWHASSDVDERLRILRQYIGANEDLRARVEAKRARLGCYLGELDARLSRSRALLEELVGEELRVPTP